jgi:hypothetical protein
MSDFSAGFRFQIVNFLASFGSSGEGKKFVPTSGFGKNHLLGTP